jgi:hypothetical protein
MIGQKLVGLLFVNGIPSIFQMNSNISGKSLGRREERMAMMEIKIPKL